MPMGAYIATKRDFAYVSVPNHAVTACKFSYGSVTVCGYFVVYIQRKFFLDGHFSYIVRVIT